MVGENGGFEYFPLESFHSECGVFRPVLNLPAVCWSEMVFAKKDKITALFHSCVNWQETLSAKEIAPFLTTPPSLPLLLSTTWEEMAPKLLDWETVKPTPSTNPVSGPPHHQQHQQQPCLWPHWPVLKPALWVRIRLHLLMRMKWTG